MTPFAAQAMVLAAGRGERMRPLTDTLPKPLLAVRGKPLMQWHLEALARSGFDKVVVNTAWLGSKIEGKFGVKSLWDNDSLLSNSEHPSNTVASTTVGSAAAPLSEHYASTLRYSHEGVDFGGALETAGGIVRTLPLLDDIFWVVAGDIYAPQFQFSQAAFAQFAASTQLAHIWLVPNPAHNAKGDFGLSESGLALSVADQRYTFSTIALYRKSFFAPERCGIASGNPQGVKAPLAPLLRQAMDAGLVSAELFTGDWTDVGTPQRLAQLNA